MLNLPRQHHRRNNRPEEQTIRVVDRNGHGLSAG